jgi:SAM-dependent methyltransferase
MRVDALIPLPLLQPLRKAKYLLNGMQYRGKDRYCPVCNKTSSKFATFGYVPRLEARCMQCGALERHRLVWLYFTRRSDLLNGPPVKMLHVAPEPLLEHSLRTRVGAGYLTADLMDRRAMVKMDITDIHFPDESFDVIYCSHVLEHVPDDRRAMREFRRTLNRNGWAVLLVPITAPATIEDPSVTDPKERLARFGQEDHVRRYGPDYVDRLREAGFEVEVTLPSDFLTADEIVRMGITPAAGEIYRCTRKA